MILGESALNELFKEGKVGPASIDLSLDSLYTLSGTSASLVDNEKINMELFKIEPVIQDRYILKGKDTYIFKCKEKIEMPVDKAGIIISRSTLFRNGLSLSTGFVDPAFNGYLSGCIVNNTTKTFYLGLNDRICQMIVFDVRANNKEYEGYYNE